MNQNFNSLSIDWVVVLLHLSRSAKLIAIQRLKLDKFGYGLDY